MSKSKRRPGRDPEMKNASAISEEAQTEFAVVDVDDDQEASFASASRAKSGGNATGSGAQNSNETASESSRSFEENLSDEPKVELNFKGSEILRAKFPKPFQVAEKIATDWVHDGRFEGLPLGHPLAQYFAAKGLRKAKEVEKKVMESPVTEKIAMQALTAGMKAQEIISQVRNKVKR
jgi:Cdc6-like AAA superfamily ATPase